MSFGGTLPARFERTNTIPNDIIYDGVSQRGTHGPSVGLQSGRRSRSSPIPPDPVYVKSDGDPHPQPRIRPEAMNIARNHQGAALASLFNPHFKVIPVGTRQGHQTPKDFGKENYRKIKEIQKANKEKSGNSQRSEPVKVVHKPGKYDHIGSKVAGQINSPPRAPRPNTTESSGNKDGEQMSSRPGRPRSASPVPRLDRLGTRRSSSVEPPRQRVNHISSNIKKACNANIKRAPSLTALDDLRKKKEDEFKGYQRGVVPKYLQDRQKQWQKEEEIRKANEPDPTIPAGHSLLPDKERLSTLAILKKSQEDMLTELRSLPLSRDTVRVKQRRESLERKLTEVDAALKIFSRPRVFIKGE